MSSVEELARTLVHDALLYAPREIEAYSICVPNRAGVYAWFFDGIDAEWNRQWSRAMGGSCFMSAFPAGADKACAGGSFRDISEAMPKYRRSEKACELSLGFEAEARLTEWIAEHGRASLAELMIRTLLNAICSTR